MTLLSRRQIALGALGVVSGGVLEGASYPYTVDSHVHVWKRDPKYPWSPDAKNVPSRDATAETLLGRMQANQVARTVLIQVIYYKWDNSYLADVLKRYPQSFMGVARVNPEDPEAPDHLSHIMSQPGFHGVRLSPAADASGDWIRGPLMRPLWKRCQDLRSPMTVLAPITRMPDVQRLAGQFPDLTIVIDHMADSPLGHPSELEKLLALRRYPKLYVKISHSWSLSAQAYPYLDAQQQIKRLYDSFGPKRLIAGTDWPLVEAYCTYAQAVNLARERISFFNKDDKEWICGRTAQQVWPFAAKS
jgi:L-fuconolactonase